MATTYSGTVGLSIILREVLTGALRTGGPLERAITESLDLAPGTLDGQINQAFAQTQTGIGASVTTVYDLIGSLKDTEGNTLNFDEVVLVAVRNRSSTAANFLLVGPDVSAGFGVLGANVGFWNDATDRSVVAASSWTVMYCPAGVPAAAGTTDELAVITAGGTSANAWDIMIFGRDNP